ncbi:MAG: hypothetical protein IT463_01190 [Planctomycetes bacterium]|nr:hypothetical protein [Planctomycetota bacterium]
MRKSLLVGAVLLLLATPASHFSQAAKPDWRTLKAAPSFLTAYYKPEKRCYELPPLRLLQHLAEQAQVPVRYDASDMETAEAMSVAAQARQDLAPVFDLCQQALAPRLTLLPEGEGFAVFTMLEAPQRAPLAATEKLDALCESEWATVVMTLEGRDGRLVQDAVGKVLSRPGGRLELTLDQQALVVTDVGRVLRKVRDMIPRLDMPREQVELVEYQRASSTDLSALCATLTEFLARYAALARLPESRIYLRWNREAGVLAGIVPRPCASFLDAAVEAAQKNAAERAAEETSREQSWVNFAVAVPEGLTALQLEGRLRALFGPEAGIGELRMTSDKDKPQTLFVRCRTWLEADVRDAIGVK